MTSAPVIPLFHFPITRPLLRAAQWGDDRAFNTIIRACKRRLLGMASRYVRWLVVVIGFGLALFYAAK